MKGFIEVYLKNDNTLLINIDSIESIMALGKYDTVIYMKTILSRHDNKNNEQELYQLNYEVCHSYEEVKAMIEEALK